MNESLPGKLTDMMSEKLTSALDSAQNNNTVAKSQGTFMTPSDVTQLLDKIINEDAVKKLQQPVHDAFKDCFVKVLVPKFEKAIGAMLSQVETSIMKRLDIH